MKGKRTLTVIGIVAAIGIVVLAFTVRGSKGSLARADRYFEDGDYVRALIEYQAVLQQEPQTLSAYQNISTIWLDRGNPLEALRYLNSAALIAPEDLEIKRKRAEALFALRQMPAVHKEALAILELAPTDPDALIHLARSSMTKAQGVETARRLEQFDPETSAPALFAQAILASREGERDEAATLLQKAQQLDPEFLPVYEMMANLHFLKKETEAGEAQLKKAAGLARPRSATRLNYIRYLARNERADEAISTLKEIIEEAPDYLPAHTLLAGLLSGQRKHEEALEALKPAFALAPRHLDAHATRTQILVAQGKLDEAVKSLEGLNSAYPNLPRIKFDLARLHQRNGNTAKARVTLEEALKTFPDYTDAELMLAELNLRTSYNESETISMLESLVKREPNLLRARLALSAAYQDGGRFDDAARLFLDQLEEDPDQSGPHYLLGMIHLRQEKTDEARKHFEAAQKIAPDDQRITAQLVNLDLISEDFEVAHQRVRAHLEKEQNVAGARFLEGRIYMEEKRWEEAEKELLQSVELNPGSIAAYNSLIDCYQATKQASDAIRTVREVLEENPGSLAHHILLALFLEQEQSFAEAAETYENALALSPDFAPALNNLAYLHTEHLPDLDKALKLARKARELQPDPAAISDTLGWIHYKRGEYSQARPLLEEAARNSPDPEIQYHVGMARFMAGKQALAAASLRNAVESEKEFPGKEEARKQLAALEGEESREQLEARVQANPNDLIARNKLGQLYARAGEFENARASYDEALRINNDSLDALVGLARLYVGPLDDLDKASPLARKARSLGENDPRAAGVLGQVNLGVREYKLAAGLLGEAIRTIRTDAGLQRDFGIAIYHVGRVREAIIALQRVGTLAPGSPEAAEAAAFLALITPPSDGDWSSLSTAAENALQDDPDHLPALMIRAAVLKAQGDRQAAIEICQAIQARLPEFSPAQKELVALLAADPATLDQAYSLGLKTHAALQSNPDPAFTRLLGMVSYKAGKADIAIRLLEEPSANLDPEGLFYLGMSYLKTNNRTKGENALQRALGGDLDEDLATEARAALAGKGAANN